MVSEFAILDQKWSEIAAGLLPLDITTTYLLDIFAAYLSDKTALYLSDITARFLLDIIAIYLSDITATLRCQSLRNSGRRISLT